jgi:translation initiation factor 1 (eIF-1/SUI1)
VLRLSLGLGPTAGAHVKKDRGGSKSGEAPSPALKHNPFAALAGARPAAVEPSSAAQPAPSAREPEPRREPVPRREPPPAAAPQPAGKTRGRLVLRRETKHRAGKAVIVIGGFAALRDFDDAATQALARELKQQLGCGGTVEGSGERREIVLQGDRAAQVAELLRARGFRVDGVTS